MAYIKSIWIIGMFVFICKACSPFEAGDSVVNIDERISYASAYLIMAVQPDGKFEYIRNFNPEAVLKGDYNVLRHSSTIYSMVQSYQYHPNDTLKSAILRAGKYLKSTLIDTLPGNPEILTIWSDPTITKSITPRSAKLGGAGLGLVALTDIEQISPGFTSIDTLRAIGKFILFMQEENGRFTSRYVPEEGGKDTKWQSLFYPGEACLALVKLYKIDPDPVWLKAAIKCLEYLANSRIRTSNYPVDHWALIATSELFKLYNEMAGIEFSHELLSEHARKITEKIVSEQITQDDNKNKIGAFSNNWETTPTSTSIEGLTSVLTFLSDTSSLYDHVVESCRLGINYLCYTQILSGENKGAFTYNVMNYETKEKEQNNRWANTEIRIDYVQHALSALVQYQQIVGSPVN